MIENNLLGIKNVQESFVALLKISRELDFKKIYVYFSVLNRVIMRDLKSGKKRFDTLIKNSLI